MSKMKIYTPKEVKNINEKNNTNQNGNRKIKIYTNGDIVEKINHLYREIKK